MDDVDRANDLAQADIDSALALRRAPSGESAHECEECGDAIPAGRRKAAPGCTRCVFCQADHDKRMGRWR